MNNTDWAKQYPISDVTNDAQSHTQFIDSHGSCIRHTATIPNELNQSVNNTSIKSTKQSFRFRLPAKTNCAFFFLPFSSFFLFFLPFFLGGGRKERFVLANFPTVACESGIASDWRSGKTLRHQHSGGVGTNSIKLNRYELFLDTNSIIRLLFRMFNVCLHLYRSEIPSKSLRKLPRNCARANEYINNRMNGFYSWIGVFFPLYNPHETGLKT